MLEYWPIIMVILFASLYALTRPRDNGEHGPDRR
jgi:hypothetical protein